MLKSEKIKGEDSNFAEVTLQTTKKVNPMGTKINPRLRLTANKNEKTFQCKPLRTKRIDSERFQKILKDSQ